MTNNEPNVDNTVSAEDILAETTRHFIETSHVVDLADWLEGLPLAQAVEEIVALPLHRRAKAFSYLPVELQTDLIGLLTRRDLAEIVTWMDADNRADLFNELTLEQQQRLLRDLAREEREDIRRLAAYAEGTAGAIIREAIPKVI